MSTVRTVLGDLRPEELGVCDAHDHLFLRSPQLPGLELDDVSAARAELAAFRAAGGGSVVQWTPYGMGRRTADLPGLSRATGCTWSVRRGCTKRRTTPRSRSTGCAADCPSCSSPS
ncbi:hypothetical protein O1M54_44040 [Streptomyces diastatochromogenes]|nr:hypothetical protein [Streptomyces diastatochromogenes]